MLFFLMFLKTKWREELVLICEVKHSVLSFFHVLLFYYRYYVVLLFKLD